MRVSITMAEKINYATKERMRTHDRKSSKLLRHQGPKGIGR